MKAIAIGSLLLGGLCLCGAQEIQPLAPKKGTYSLGFSVDYFKGQDSAAMTDVRVFPTYFVTDNVEVGVPFTWSHTSGFDETGIGALVRFYFMSNNNTSQLKPFIGGIWQSFHSTGGSNDTFFGGELGAHYFVANNVAVTGELIIGSDRFEGVSTSSTEFSLGFTIFFAGPK